MNRRQYIEHVRSQLVRFYRMQRDGQWPSDQERGRIEGFMQAGVSLGIYTERDRNRMITVARDQIFGIDSSHMYEDIEMVEYSQAQDGEPAVEFNVEVSSSQQASAGTSGWQDDTPDYSEYESPTFGRRLQGLGVADQ